MLFNSFDFAVFLPIVFVLYWAFGYNQKIKNIIILIASYVFYGAWDYRFLGLIFLSSLIDYIAGQRIEEAIQTSKKKAYLALSIITNLGILGFFKYYNFFLSELSQNISILGLDYNALRLDIVLPVGISFYTFQTMSYSIDVYRNKLKASHNPIAFFAYVAFFPQLVAGPIERATNLLPQFTVSKKFNYDLAVDGLKQIIWGLFKKVAIADNCAKFADMMYSSPSDYNGSSLLLASFFFTFQIYCDFSGYSDIAIGTGKLFGFKLMTNFKTPYFSRDIAEFWRRWHISLSTWFRDYLYIPLGGSRVIKSRAVINTFIVFGVSGFWHGANWTFIVWGLMNAILFLPLLIFGKNRKNVNIQSTYTFANIKEIMQVAITFTLVMLMWVVFRAESLGQAIEVYSIIFSKSLLNIPSFTNMAIAMHTIILISAMIVIEWINRGEEHTLSNVLNNKPLVVRWAFYYLLIGATFYFAGTQEQFIYFQF